MRCRTDPAGSPAFSPPVSSEAPQAADLPDRAHLREAHQRVDSDVGAREILGDERRAHRDFAGHPRGTRLSVVCHTRGRRDGDLVVGSHGWALADAAGLLYYRLKKKTLLT